MIEFQYFSEHIRFTIPVSVEQLGFTEHKTVTVLKRLLPVMAQIIENATRPKLLTQQYEADGRAVAAMDDSMLDYLRERTQYDLEHGLREEAKRQGLAVITAVTFEEQPFASTDGGGILFTAQATAMPLLDKGIER